jgi:O-antigen/teichoic acid export membrane protein
MFKKIVSYSIGLYAVTIFTALVHVVLKSLIAKIAGKEALGSYAFFTTAQQLGVSICAFGLIRALAKHVAADEESKYGPVVSVIMVLLIILSTALTGMAFLLHRHLDWIWVLILMGVGPATLFQLARSSLRGQFERNQEILTVLFSICVQGILVALTIKLSPTPQALITSVVVANVITAAAVILYFVQRHPAWWKPTQLYQACTSNEFNNLLGLTTPLWITDVLAIVGHQADQFIVKGQLGYAPLAEYSAAFTFIGLLSHPLSVLSRIFLVTFAGGFYTDVKKYRRVSSLNLALISTLGLTVTVLSFPLTPILFTDEYTLVPTLTTILSMAFVFKSVEVLNTALTIARDYPQANRNSKLWTTALYIPLAFLMVTWFGVTGAAWSYVGSWGGYALIHALYMRRRLPEHAAHTLRVTTIGTMLYVGIAWSTWWLNLGWFALLSIPLYLGLGHLLRLWHLDQIPDLTRRLLSSHPSEAMTLQ